MPKHPSSPGDTREQILEAAGEIFAKQGFHATTVRQITRKAGVNVAAVNYHFHDKHELYVSVLKRAHQAAAKTAEADLAGTPEERLRTFIRMFLGYLLDPQRPEWHGSLIAREMAQPTQALDRLIAESIEPVRQRIGGIVQSILGPGAAKTQVSLSALSVIGQCLHYVQCRETISRLFPKGSHVYRDVEILTEHIFQFSLAGLKALRVPTKSKPRRARLAAK
jgi:TetR/AcrR family transcriptional regulator, regulator of cefoperazone and chloramphenicol sensitivity